jgi:hypothetical protein
MTKQIPTFVVIGTTLIHIAFFGTVGALIGSTIGIAPIGGFVGCCIGSAIARRL